MATLQISIEIDDEAVTGHALNKLKTQFGDSVGVIADRIGRANAQTFPRHEYDPINIIVRAVAAAVEAAET